MNPFLTIAIEKMNAFFVPRSQTEFRVPRVSSSLVSNFNLELSSFGYFLDVQAINYLKVLSNDEFNLICSQALSYFHKKTNSDLDYKSLFAGFPDTVPEGHDYLIKRFLAVLDERHLGVNVTKSEDFALLDCGHFIDQDVFSLDDFNACPICQCGTIEHKEKDIKQFNSFYANFKTLKFVSYEDVLSCFKDMLGAKLSFSEHDKELIQAVYDFDANTFVENLPSEFLNKENMVFILGLVMSQDNAIKILFKHVKTATDILRLAAYFSGANVSLSEKIKFRLKNKERNIILTLINQKSCSYEDMLRFKNEWLALAKYLHIGAASKKYTRAKKKVNLIRNDHKSITTFQSELEKMLSVLPEMTDVEFDGFLSFVSTRGGVFARNLDFIIRNVDTDKGFKTLCSFEKVIGTISNNVLLSIYKYFSSYGNLNYRAVFPKGSIMKMKVIKETEKKASKIIVQSFVDLLEKELTTRFSEKTHFENVYIDESVLQSIVPFSVRSGSKTDRPIVRGSRVKINLEKNNILRFFSHWFNVNKEKSTPSNNVRVDLDLSAVMVDENFNYAGSISYSDYSDLNYASYSGDRQDGGSNGAAEFIDINLDKFNNSNSDARYIIISLNSYTEQNFSTFTSLAGVQLRNSSDKGELYEPQTLINSFSLNGDATYAVPFIYDLKNQELIWVDIYGNPKFNKSRVNNIFENERSLNTIVKVFSDFQDVKLTMKDLIKLHSSRFNSIDFEFDSEKEYDLIIDQEFLFNQSNIIANWI